MYRFKVGDRVTVSCVTAEDEWRKPYFFVEAMLPLKGKAYTVADITEVGGYMLSGEAMGWVFSEEWLSFAEDLSLEELSGISVHATNVPKHNHYFKDVSQLGSIDVYRIIELYAITDPCIQHMLKKCLVAGGRGAGKDISTDIQEVIDTAERWKEMRKENTRKVA